MQTYDYDELVNKPGRLTEDEDLYIIIEGQRRQLKELLEDVIAQLKLERDNWGGEEGENTEDLTDLINRVAEYYHDYLA